MQTNQKTKMDITTNQNNSFINLNYFFSKCFFNRPIRYIYSSASFQSDNRLPADATMSKTTMIKNSVNIIYVYYSYLIMLFNYLLIGNKKEKDSHYGRRRLFSKVGYSLNESSAISLLRVISFFSEKIRFVSQKLNFKFFNHGDRAIKFMNSKNENLTNYAEAILHYLSKHFSKESDALTPEQFLSVAGNTLIKKETRSPFTSSTHLLFDVNGLSGSIANIN